MKTQQKLVKNGNSIQVTITRWMLAALEWLPSQAVHLTVVERLFAGYPCPVCHRALPDTFVPQPPSLIIRPALTPDEDARGMKPALMMQPPELPR